MEVNDLIFVGAYSGLTPFLFNNFFLSRIAFKSLYTSRYPMSEAKRMEISDMFVSKDEVGKHILCCFLSLDTAVIDRAQNI